VILRPDLGCARSQKNIARSIFFNLRNVETERYTSEKHELKLLDLEIYEFDLAFLSDLVSFQSYGSLKQTERAIHFWLLLEQFKRQGKWFQTTRLCGRLMCSSIRFNFSLCHMKINFQWGWIWLLYLFISKELLKFSFEEVCKCLWSFVKCHSGLMMFYYVGKVKGCTLIFYEFSLNAWKFALSWKKLKGKIPLPRLYKATIGSAF